MRVITISAKCADCFAARYSEGDKAGSYFGYVPSWMPGKHFGETVELKIDADTGQILNWVPPSHAVIEATFFSG
jgi:hypothetical protein